jgi:hypothetical protein
MSRPTSLAIGFPDTTTAAGAFVTRAFPVNRHEGEIPVFGKVPPAGLDEWHAERAKRKTTPTMR